MTVTIASSWLTSLDADETLSEYPGISPEKPMNLEANYSTFLNPDLQSFPQHMQSLQLNSTSLAAASEAFNFFRERIYKNQLQANERSIRQYREQRVVKNFEIGTVVSVAVPVLTRSNIHGWQTDFWANQTGSLRPHLRDPDQLRRIRPQFSYIRISASAISNRLGDISACAASKNNPTRYNGSRKYYR